MHLLLLCEGHRVSHSVRQGSLVVRSAHFAGISSPDYGTISSCASTLVNLLVLALGSVLPVEKQGTLPFPGDKLSRRRQ